MLFIKYSIIILASLGALAGVIIGLKNLPASLRTCKENEISGFMMLPFVFSPLSQIIYSVIMGALISSSIEKNGQDQAVSSKVIIIGLVIGLIFMLSALAKSYIGKRACRVISTTGKGFHKYLMICGFAETMGIFALVFGLIALKLG